MNNINHQRPCAYTSAWEQERLKWKATPSRTEKRASTPADEFVDDFDHYENEPFLEFPNEPSMVEEIKDTLKSTRRPYERFDGYFKLEDIIDQYMYIWYEETTSSD
jgi:hypothetical protein